MNGRPGAERRPDGPEVVAENRIDPDLAENGLPGHSGGALDRDHPVRGAAYELVLDEGHGTDARKGAKLFGHAPVEGNPGGVGLDREVRHEDARGIESGIDAPRFREAPDEQARSEDQYDGEGKLKDDQRVAEVQVARPA